MVQTVEREVVDRADGGDAQAARLHQQWRQRGMPVVRVDQLRHRQRGLAGGDGRGGMGQRGKALGVVAEVASGGIDVERAGTVIQRRTVEKHHPYTGVGHLALQQARRAVARRQCHGQMHRAQAAHVARGGHRTRVARHQHRDIGAALMQRLGEPAHHIGQSAGLGQRLRFRRHKQCVRVQG